MTAWYTTLAERIRALAESGTPGPLRAATTGPRGGDHWYLLDHVGGMVARIRSDDGDNEETRGPDARKIAAAVNALPALADLVEAVTLRHWPQDGRDCAECGDEWPCPTATALDALAAALGVAQ